MEWQDRLQQGRLDRGETVAAAARRAGVTERHVHAIESGRFADLPAGIYARAALRAYAASLGFDPVEVLAACDALLPVVDDPIDGIARTKGFRVSRAVPHAAEAAVPVPGAGDAPTAPDWRLPAAAAVDACAIGATLLVVILSAALMTGAPPAALHRSAGAFAVIGLLLGAWYFVSLAGVPGATTGQRWIEPRQSAAPRTGAARTLHAIARAAARSATADARFLRDLGTWAGRQSLRDPRRESSSDTRRDAPVPG